MYIISLDDREGPHMVQWETDSAVSTSIPAASSFNLPKKKKKNELRGCAESRKRDPVRGTLEEVSYGLCISARCLYLSPASLAHHSPFFFIFFFFSSFPFLVRKTCHSYAVYRTDTAAACSL